MDDRIFELHAEVCKTLANPWRLKLIELLRDGERPLKELVEETNIPLANVSQHLNIMKAAGVVEVRREASRSFYRLANPKILKAFDLMREGSGIAHGGQRDLATNRRHLHGFGK